MNEELTWEGKASEDRERMIVELRSALKYTFDRVGQSELFAAGVDPNHYEDICPGATRAAKEGSGERLYKSMNDS